MKGDSSRLAVLLALLLGMVAACTAPQPTLSPPTAAGEALFSDDFSSPTDHWRLFDADGGRAEIRDGAFYLQAMGGKTSLYAPLLLGTWNDVVASVGVRQVEGTEDNWMGLLCRQRDVDNYYLFAISADGYYLMLKVRNGVQEPLAGPTYSTLIRPGLAWNRLTVRCEGSSLQMSVNGRFLVNRTDADLARGGIALFADALRGGGTTVAFDDFRLTQP